MNFEKWKKAPRDRWAHLSLLGRMRMFEFTPSLIIESEFVSEETKVLVRKVQGDLALLSQSLARDLQLLKQYKSKR